MIRKHFFILNLFLGILNVTHAQTIDSSESEIMVQTKYDQSKYGLYARLQAREGKGKELVSILLQAAEIISRIEECHLYLINTDQSNSDLIWVTEVWNTKEAHDRSLTIEDVRQLIGQAMPLLDEHQEKGPELLVVGGWGLNKVNNDDY